MKKIILTTIICFLAQVIFSQTQTATITGKVTNEKNGAVPYATIKVKNGKEATQADAQGRFRLRVTSLPVVLHISSTEYDEKEVSVTNSDEVAVTLLANDGTLDPVIINASGDSRLRVKILDAAFPY